LDQSNPTADPNRPNVILILVDDMGFADLGMMGSEIRTPNLNQLAGNGALMSSMYNCARCCPTRASLLTGLYPHNAGIGHMGANLGTPAYQGFLRNDSVTIAEVLGQSGYRTAMSGKWHVAGDFEARDVDNWRTGDLDHPTPRQRGFDQFYGILDGASHFFSPHCVFRNEDRIEITEDNYYFTDAITNKAIEMISNPTDADSPFFLYLAHTAPHWPLHARPDDIARYDGSYQSGWDSIRTARHEEMNGLGVLSENWAISPRDETVMPWQAVKYKDWEAAKMATYAAMIDSLDQSVGRLINALKEQNQFDNTLILFLSDNGGCAEFMAEDGWAQYYPDQTLDGRPISMGNIPNLNPGDDQTFQSYDKPWANVSNAPFRLYKHYVHEGGISTPLIAHWPNRIKPGQVIHDPWHVVDILPTILETTDSPYLTEYGGHEIQPLEGASFLERLCGSPSHRESPIFFEHEGHSAIRYNNLKLVRQHNQDWELYDMNKDRTELNNLAGQHPLTEIELKAMYQDWAKKAGVMHWEDVLPRLLQAWNLSSVDG
jgi:arylsulfatase A-like enzyme